MKRWEKRQNKGIQDAGGKAHRGSGNKWYCLSDGHRRYFRFEHKGTDKGQYRLSRGALVKIGRESVLNRMRPAFIINMQGQVWIGVPKHIFDSMTKVADLKDQ